MAITPNLSGDTAASTKRREPRFACRPTNVTAIETGLRLTATVVEVSRSGCRLHVDSLVPVGTRVVVEFERHRLSGRIRYCRIDSPGVFEAGVETEDFSNTPTVVT